MRQRKTHCVQGHEYTPENTRIHHGRRECKTCHREREKKRCRTNPQKNRARAAAWQKANPERHKASAADYSLRKLYGITLADKAAMLAEQNGLCAACPAEIELYSSHTDHNHVTGKVRGLLCEICNLTIGNARESVSRLRSLADYLERHGQ